LYFDTLLRTKMKHLLLLLSLGSIAFGTINVPQSFDAHFKQTITNSDAKAIAYQEEIHFSTPKRFRWDYTHPTQKEVCSDGDEIIIVDHDLEQVSSYSMQESIDIVEILESAKLYSPNIYLATYQEQTYTIQIHNNKLHSIAYFDTLENKVQILFSDMVYSTKTLSQTRMGCRYPKQYDIIEG